MKNFLPEEELIEYVKPYLKAKGFKKKNKTWIKDIGDFTLYFYVQGSCFSKETYYIVTANMHIRWNCINTNTWSYIICFF